jgi:hypothetical protein
MEISSHGTLIKILRFQLPSKGYDVFDWGLAGAVWGRAGLAQMFCGLARIAFLGQIEMDAGPLQAGKTAFHC